MEDFPYSKIFNLNNFSSSHFMNIMVRYYWYFSKQIPANNFIATIADKSKLFTIYVTDSYIHTHIRTHTHTADMDECKNVDYIVRIAYGFLIADSSSDNFDHTMDTAIIVLFGLLLSEVCICICYDYYPIRRLFIVY